MRGVKLFCVLMAALFTLSAVATVANFHYGRTAPLFPGPGWLRGMVALFEAILLLAVAYGIQTKRPIAWKLGWLAVAVFTVQNLALVVPFAAKQPKPTILASLISLGVLSVTAYFSRFWWRHRAYFNGS